MADVAIWLGILLFVVVASCFARCLADSLPKVASFVPRADLLQSLAKQFPGWADASHVVQLVNWQSWLCWLQHRSVAADGLQGWQGWIGVVMRLPDARLACGQHGWLAVCHARQNLLWYQPNRRVLKSLRVDSPGV